MGTGFLILILNPFCPHWLFATLILIILSVKKLHSLCIGSFRYIPFSILISAFYELNQTTIKLFPVSGLLFGLYSSSIVLEFQRPYMGILPLFFFNDIAKSLYLLCLVYWCHGSSQSPISSPYCILFFYILGPTSFLDCTYSSIPGGDLPCSTAWGGLLSSN